MENLCKIPDIDHKTSLMLPFNDFTPPVMASPLYAAAKTFLTLYKAETQLSKTIKYNNKNQLEKSRALKLPLGDSLHLWHLEGKCGQQDSVQLLN